MGNLELSLNGSWKFKGFAPEKGQESEAYKPEYDDAKWLVGKVPGTVHTDLMANKVIPDPFKDLNEKEVEWVPHNEWWYRKQFELPKDFFGKRTVDLIFDGLDTFASVWVNGAKVGETNNMFTPWQFNISKALKEGKNIVAICFKPIYKVAANLERKFGGKYGSLHAENFSARPYVRKAQYSFGWDWGPTMPTAGIWRHAKIIAYDHIRLGYLSVLPLEVSADKAKIEAVAQIYSTVDCDVRAKFVVEGFGQRVEKEVSGHLSLGQNFLEAEFELDQPQLWWPKGYGEPNLYDASVELCSNGSLLDKRAVKCGIRNVALLQEPDDEGQSFVFAINGLRVFCKGACWIPADSFLPRVTQDRYQKLLSLTAEANFNMLRVWGGGIYEDDAFYEACDRLGLMVWQDFMYACCAYPEDDWFLAEAKREAEWVVRRLRGHVCIVVWCGNNEIQWQYQSIWKDTPHLYGQAIFDKILPEVLSRLDGTRPYRPSTPYGGKDPNSEHEGNRHNWIVWSRKVDYPAYLQDRGRFLTEFGWQAPSALKLLREYLDATDLKLSSETLEAHEKQVDGLKILRALLSLHYPVPEDFGRFVLYSQLNQADALKLAVMHWRSRMFKTAGCLIWQFNDCWPVISWSLIDYGLNPKPAYFAVKRVCEPIIAPLFVRKGRVSIYIVNETNQDLELTLRFQVLKFRGESLHAENKKMTAPAYTSLLVLDGALEKLPVAGDCILTVALEDKGDIIYEDSKTVKELKELDLPKPQIKVEVKKIGVGTFKILLESPIYAKAVNLDSDYLKGKFSDNFFDLLPNSSKSVKCLLGSDLSLTEFKQKLTWQSYPYIPI